MWDKRYSDPEFYYGTAPNDYLKAKAALLPPHARVLSLGEGEGRNALYLASLGCEVVALDQSPVGLAKAKNLCLAAGFSLDTIAMDLADYRFVPNQWDAIISIWCHLPSDLRRQVHAQVAASLKPGGLFILECYRPEQIALATGGPKDMDLLPSLAELSEDLRSLSLLECQAVERIVMEGRGHHGLSAVNQILARRLT
jgi:SAM-dependent methyltransferase